MFRFLFTHVPIGNKVIPNAIAMTMMRSSLVLTLSLVVTLALMTLLASAAEKSVKVYKDSPARWEKVAELRIAKSNREGAV